MDTITRSERFLNLLGPRRSSFSQRFFRSGGSKAYASRCACHLRPESVFDRSEECRYRETNETGSYTTRCRDCPEKTTNRAELTSDFVEKHLAGELQDEWGEDHPLGVYLVDDDEMVRTLVADLDGKKSESWEDDTIRLASWLESKGLDPVATLSQSAFGSHVLVILDQPVPLEVAAAFWGEVRAEFEHEPLTSLDLTIPEPTTRCGPGHLISLWHYGNEETGRILDEEGEPRSLDDILANPPLSSAATLTEIARASITTTTGVRSDAADESRGKSVVTNEKELSERACELLRHLRAEFPSEAERLDLFSECEFVRDQVVLGARLLSERLWFYVAQICSAAFGEDLGWKLFKGLSELDAVRFDPREASEKFQNALTYKRAPSWAKHKDAGARCAKCDQGTCGRLKLVRKRRKKNASSEDGKNQQDSVTPAELAQMLVDRGYRCVRVDGQAQIVTLDGRLFPASERSDDLAVLLYRELGLNRKRAAANFEAVRLELMCRAEAVEVGRVMSICESDMLLPGERGGVVLRVSEDGAKHEENDQVFFRAGLIRHIATIPTVFGRELCELRDRIVSWLPLAPVEAAFLMAFFLLLFLDPLRGSRAIVQITGKTGSGKTEAARRCGALISGTSDFLVDPSPAALDVLAAEMPLIAIDNVENANVNRKMMDFLLRSTSHVRAVIRDVRSPNGLLHRHRECDVVLTGIEPILRPELRRRTIELTASPTFHRHDFVSDDVVIGKILKLRDEMLGAALVAIRRFALPRLQSPEQMRALNVLFAGVSARKQGLVPTLAQCVAVHEALVKADPAYSKIGGADLASGLCELLRVQSTDLESATSELLVLFGQLPPAISSQTVSLRIVNGQLEDTYSRLLAALRILAKAQNIRCPVDSAAALQRRIEESRGVLESAGWGIEKGPMIHGIQRWRFKAPERLSVAKQRSIPRGAGQTPKRIPAVRSAKRIVPESNEQAGLKAEGNTNGVTVHRQEETPTPEELSE